MKAEQLTNEEILRIITPETDLEKVLFVRLRDQIEETEADLQDRADIVEADCEDLEERVVYLETLLDENEIEYEK